ncbi:phosphoserine phosphatase SerB [Mangrovicoccus ximenensis]|uniref:phosphoserine phosphatase SerB n=1 Tax=Mangrovicoccus ximenensis TaxID=1911570 RepID=UPI000D33688D|nr:phosphoserine phosphatase SerB [Mangrovicoccus ximenensis]
MYIATLLTNPAAPCLDAATAESLAEAWGGGALRWLAPGEAAEFALGTLPEDLWDRWEALQAQGIDLAVQPADGRRRRMLLADMDSTMIGQECIDELADMAGVGERVKDITARAMNGELDFEGALAERVGLLAGLPESVIAEVYDARITMAPGGKVLIATMKANGGHAALVSGGFTAFTERVAAELGFDEHRANTLLAEGGKLTGDVGRPILGREAKVEALHQISARLGFSAAEVIAVGDGANDLGMLHEAGAGVALHAKPSVAAQAKLRVNHGDLTALLFLQGYSKAEFVL